ncbi:glycosyltransferase family 2 protein [Patescibacteria group bacterium]|nr:glycosyltransferase family 2 protein [Patescibacteria group bacterium]
MKTPSIYAIIANWNGKTDTLECLSSLRVVREKQPSLSVVVVDNGSTDGSVEEITKKFPWVHCVEVGMNLGFSGGNNRGITYVLKQNAEYVWLLNNDTVVDKNVLSAISSFSDPTVGAVGSKIYFYKGCEYHKGRYKKSDLGKVLWYAGGIIDWNNVLASHRGVDEVDHGQFDVEVKTDFITGCSFFIRTSVIKQVGLLDESFFMYMEDLDYSLRIQRLGLKTVYNPASMLWHKNASSSGGSGSSLHEYYQTRNRIRIGMKYAPPRTKVALLKEGFRTFFKGTGIRKQAVFDAFRSRFGEYHE